MDIKNSINTNDMVQEPFKFKSKVSRKKVYWISQISGWLILVIFNISIISLFNHFTWQRVLTSLYFGYIGVNFTHIFRAFIIKKKWLTFNLKKVIPRVIVACFLIGILMLVLILSVNIASSLLEFSKIKVGTIVGGIINFSGLNFIWSLIYFSIHYFQNYKKAEVEALIWEAAVKDYELRTLKSQLNPHFIFNALNSIRALIKENPDNAQTAVTYLSNILRYSLKIEHIETVPLTDEIQVVSDYLQLELIRFEERLNYKIDVDPLSRQIKIPPMMIQTLVENGLKHGLAKKENGGEISVKTKIINSNNLRIEIRNTGNINDADIKKAKGFGISNTKNRLNIIYNDKAYFNIENENNNTVIATIEIPFGGENESINN